MSDITLTAVQRATLSSLQQVTDLQARTQTRLNTGKKVNSASDDAVAYFKAQALSQRSTDFTNFKSNIDQSIQTVNSALTATSSVESILNQLKGCFKCFWQFGQPECRGNHRIQGFVQAAVSAGESLDLPGAQYPVRDIDEFDDASVGSDGGHLYDQRLQSDRDRGWQFAFPVYRCQQCLQ